MTTAVKLAVFGVLVLLLLQPRASFPLEVVTGDLAPRGNTDGVLSVADLVVLERLILGGQTPTAQELLAGDVAPLGGPDGELNIGDLLVLEQALLGLITLPAITSDGALSVANINLISVSDPVSGQVQITGDVGAVAGGATVEIINYETGDSVMVTANADGSFATGLPAELGHALSITVQDSSGTPGPAISVGVGNIIDLQVTMPLEGSQVNADSVLVSGTINAPANTGVTVNGKIACVIGNSFYAENVLLSPGSNNLVVEAVTIDGVKSSVTRAISSSGPGLMKFDTDSPCGYAQHTAKFNITNDSSQSIQQIDIDFDGDGTVDLSTTNTADTLEYVYQSPGAYPATATIIDTAGTSYSLTSVVVVNDVTLTDSMLQGLYVKMKDRLRTGALDGALNTINAASNEKYWSIFSSLAASMSTVVDQLGVIESSSIGTDMAEYILVRDDGSLRLHYLIYMMRGEDGVWRISNM